MSFRLRDDTIPNQFHWRIAILVFGLALWYGYAAANAILVAWAVEYTLAGVIWLGNRRVPL